MESQYWTESRIGRDEPKSIIRSIFSLCDNNLNNFIFICTTTHSTRHAKWSYNARNTTTLIEIYHQTFVICTRRYLCWAGHSWSCRLRGCWSRWEASRLMGKATLPMVCCFVSTATSTPTCKWTARLNDSCSNVNNHPSCARQIMYLIRKNQCSAGGAIREYNTINNSFRRGGVSINQSFTKMKSDYYLNHLLFNTQFS